MPPGNRLAAQFMRELAESDDLFIYKRSRATTLRDAFTDIDPTVRLIGDATRADEKQESGADQRLLFRTAKGRNVYIYQTEDEVWIDVSDLPEGGGGSAIYAAVGDYAFNTGRCSRATPPASPTSPSGAAPRTCWRRR